MYIYIFYCNSYLNTCIYCNIWNNVYISSWTAKLYVHVCQSHIEFAIRVQYVIQKCRSTSCWVQSIKLWMILSIIVTINDTYACFLYRTICSLLLLVVVVVFHSNIGGLVIVNSKKIMLFIECSTKTVPSWNKLIVYVGNLERAFMSSMFLNAHFAFLKRFKSYVICFKATSGILIASLKPQTKIYNNMQY